VLKASKHEANPEKSLPIQSHKISVGYAGIRLRLAQAGKACKCRSQKLAEAFPLLSGNVGKRHNLNGWCGRGWLEQGLVTATVGMGRVHP